MSWVSSQWPGLLAGFFLVIALATAPGLYGFLRRAFKPAPIAPTCRKCGKPGSTICWTCSSRGPDVSKLDRDDEPIRDKEAEKAAFRAKMKELNRGKAS